MKYKEVSQEEARERCMYKRALRKAKIEFNMHEPTKVLLERVTEANLPLIPLMS